MPKTLVNPSPDPVRVTFDDGSTRIVPAYGMVEIAGHATITGTQRLQPTPPHERTTQP
jgi:hypothetical protein